MNVHELVIKMNVANKHGGRIKMGLYCLVLSILPSYIKIESDNPKKFKLILQGFLYENSFYFIL